MDTEETESDSAMVKFLISTPVAIFHCDIPFGAKVSNAEPEGDVTTSKHKLTLHNASDTLRITNM
jgi:hypothetical protein